MLFRWLIALIFLASAASAQQIEQQIEIQNIIELQSENLPEDYDLSEIFRSFRRLEKASANP